MTNTPKDAATLILMRPCNRRGITDIETLLVLRSAQSNFLPGYCVFPGGALDAEDYAPGAEYFVRGMDRTGAARIMADLSPPEKAQGLWVAAIRETFEETGVLFAQKKDGTPVILKNEGDRRRYEKRRQEINSGNYKFMRMLEEEEIFLSAQFLHYFSRWITPEIYPLRYDARFFIAEFPHGQFAAPDGVELTGHVWLRPSDALAAYRAGKMQMILPQIMTLEELSHFQTMSDALNAARCRQIPANLTKIRNINGKKIEVMPDGAVYQLRPPAYP